MGPNFFTYASSKLTNDGFICWLLNWCTFPGSELYGVAMDLLSLFLENEDQALHVKDLKVTQGYQNIDMVFEINETDLLVIEGKSDSKEHPNRLQQYKTVIERDFPSYPEENRIFIYLKIGDQSSYQRVESAGYRLVHREELLKIFQSHAYITHPIFRQYCDYLATIQSQVESFRVTPLKEWSARAWQGFYKDLQRQKALTGDQWGYMSHSKRGFWGFWWNFTGFPNQERPDYFTYLQMEEQRIAFRIEIANPNRPGHEKSDIRNAVWTIFKDLLHEEDTLAFRPAKTNFQQGNHMSIAEITGLDTQTTLMNATACAEDLMDQLNQNLMP